MFLGPISFPFVLITQKAAFDCFPVVFGNNIAGAIVSQ